MKASLRTKLLLVISTMLFVALTSYLVLAVQLFNNDKSTYIFEGNATLVNTIAAETAANLKNIRKTLDLMAASVNSTEAISSIQTRTLQALFDGEDELVEVSIFDIAKYPASPSWQTSRSDFTKPYKLNDMEFDKLRRQANVETKTLLQQNMRLGSVKGPSGISLLQMYITFSTPVGPRTIVAHLRQDRRIKLYSRSEIFTTYLADKYGNLLVHPNLEQMDASNSLAGSKIFSEITKQKFDTGVRAMTQDDVEKIVAYSRIPEYGLIVVSEITKTKAFLASQRLIEKSVMFAVLILMISFMVSLIFSKRITSPLMRLYLATKEITRGNFLVQVNVKSADEVGALSNSFNQMAQEIGRLMQETADKARMEKELETAQLVQDNFFPVNELNMGPISVASFYKPASECGGDWWGHFVMNNHLVVLIGDATGHGVPSALITAAAQSCCSTLESISRDNPNLKLSPAIILEKLNHSIFRASRGTVKMTFFCGVIDMKSFKLTFANASHEMPFICHVNPEQPEAPRQKKDVAVCTGKSGFILGHEQQATYEEHMIPILPGEVLVLYTDGLTENKNAEDQMYGKGRLLRFIYKNAHHTAEEFRDKLVQDAIEYYGERSRDDDVTLVVIKHNTDAVSRVA